MNDSDLGRAFRKRYNLAVVLGPTASGKTRIGVDLARRLGGEIISADSRQVYRGMDLGTGKDLAVYAQGGDPIRYHLIDILDPAEEFSVFAFQTHFNSLFSEIMDRGNLPVLVGGTGLYLDSVIRAYRLPAVPPNPVIRDALAGEDIGCLQHRFLAAVLEVHNTTDLLDRSRIVRAIEIQAYKQAHPECTAAAIPLSPLIIGIRLEREELRRRIAARLIERIEAGMIEEVQSLHDRGISWQRIDSFGLEYRYCALHLQGRLDRTDLVPLLTTRIQQYAKRQSTWFRRMERHGVLIHWLDGSAAAAAVEQIAGLIG
jgi:tRNA dimethylallyltransferase